MLQTRIIPPAEGAYQYPLLIKRLLMSGARYEKTREIVYRDKLRYTYPTLIERVARLANVLSEAGVKAYIAFHEALFALTTNPIFQSVVQQTGNALKQSADMLRNSPEHLAARLKENEAVVRAIRERSSAKASAQMRQHIVAEGLRMGIALNIPDEHPHP